MPSEAADEIDRLRAANARLTATLEKIADFKPHGIQTNMALRALEQVALGHEQSPGETK